MEMGWWLNKPCADCIYWKEDDLSYEDDYCYSCHNKNSENYWCRADYIDECNDRKTHED